VSGFGSKALRFVRGAFVFAVSRSRASQPAGSRRRRVVDLPEGFAEVGLGVALEVKVEALVERQIE